MAIEIIGLGDLLDAESGATLEDIEQLWLNATVIQLF